MKQYISGKTRHGRQSPPPRGRGLKLEYNNGKKATRQSPPPRGRGLKPGNSGYFWLCNVVAPSTGAWIETLLFWSDNLIKKVAPSTGAWIETLTISLMAITTWVAPSTGAWIETSPALPKGNGKDMSPPPRGRGLKLDEQTPHQAQLMSPPPRGRGLKRFFWLMLAHGYVAPSTGAWIETL